MKAEWVQAAHSTDSCFSTLTQFQPVWDLIVRADKGKMGKIAEHPFENIPEMQELDLTECKLEGP